MDDPYNEIDEYEIMYQYELEAAQSALDSIEEHPTSNPKVKHLHTSISAVSSDTLVSKTESIDLEPTRKRPKQSMSHCLFSNDSGGISINELHREQIPVSSEISDYSSDHVKQFKKMNMKEEESKLSNRPFLDCESVACTLLNGGRYYLRRESKTIFKESAERQLSSERKQLLEVSVTDLLQSIDNKTVQDIVQKEAYNSEKVVELQGLIKEIKEPKKSRSGLLFQDKYRPEKFIDLLSDEKINRNALQWIKAWDDFVYGPKTKQNQTKKSQNIYGVNEEKKELYDTRLNEKVLLLAGPPGSGKTTLSHIIARHCGYNAIEVNASDDRTSSVLREKVISAMEMTSIWGNSNPSCIILDEIDGAMNGSDGRNAISALLSIINGYSKSKKGSTRKPLLTRPMICICNDLYAPVLRPLRAVAKTFVLDPPSRKKLLNRLQNIVKEEDMKTSTSALSLLCERSNCDVRFCLNTLEVAKTQSTYITQEIMMQVLGKKDETCSLFDVWDTVFFQKKRPRSRDDDKSTKKTTSFSRVYDAAMGAAEHEFMLGGLHENIYKMAFNDPTMIKLLDSLEWMGNADMCFKRYRSAQQFSLSKYMPLASIGIHLNFCSSSKKKIDFPRKVHEHLASIEKKRNILRDFLSGAKVMLGLHSSLQSISIDLIPWMLLILSPPKPKFTSRTIAKDEKQFIEDLIIRYSEMGLSFLRIKEQDQIQITKYSLDPPLQEIVSYEELELDPRKKLSATLQETLMKEIELRKMRNDHQVEKEKKTPIKAKSTPRIDEENKVSAQFSFFAKKSCDNKTNSDEKTQQKLRLPFRFKFNQGYTCGIKREVKIADFL